MSESEVLKLFGHELLPAEHRDASVLSWVCRECGERHDDPVAFRGVECR